MHRFSLAHMPSCLLPSSNCMYISSFKIPYKKAHFMFSCWGYQWWCTVSVRRSCKESYLTTWEKTSSKSNPDCWEKLWATSLALYRHIFLKASLFNLNTHLDPTIFLPLGSGTTSQVFWVYNASSSWSIATFQFSYSGLSSAWLYVLGFDFSIDCFQSCS